MSPQKMLSAGPNGDRLADKQTLLMRGINAKNDDDDCILRQHWLECLKTQLKENRLSIMSETSIMAQYKFEQTIR